MSNKTFLDCTDTQLKNLIIQMVSNGEKKEREALFSTLMLREDIRVSYNTEIILWYNKALIMQLERLNKKMDTLTEAIKQLKET